jgi:ubiquinone biosynthesis protein COQ9
MTQAKTTKRKSADDDAALKLAVTRAALAHIPFDGFTDKVLNAAASDAGVDKKVLARLFPGGPLDLVEALSTMFDDDMEARLAKAKMDSLKVRARIAKAVKTRIEILKPHKEAARRAAAFLTLPPHAARGVTLLYRTVDAMWRAAGDTSTDFNFYTKRAILAGVYSATLMRWFNDTSEDESETDAFLTRRIDDVMRFEKFKANIRERAKHLPSLSDILGGPRAKRS